MSEKLTLPDGEVSSVVERLKEITTSELPADAAQHVRKHGVYILGFDKHYLPHVYATTLSEAEALYLLERPPSDEVHPKTDFFLLEYVNKAFAGFTSVEVSPDEGSATVVNTATMTDFLKADRAGTRLRFLNQYCLQRFGVPLASGRPLMPGGRRVWEKLVEKGEAEPRGEPLAGYVFRRK